MIFSRIEGFSFNFSHLKIRVDLLQVDMEINGGKLNKQLCAY